MTLQSSVFGSSKIKTSLNFGFLGLGMGGNSIAAACAEVSTNIPNNKYPYSALLVNTNQVDLDRIEVDNPKTKKLLIGNGRGAGRSIKQGEQMFVESSDKVAEELKSHFSKTDFLWVVAGLGGGTGTGSIIEAIRTVMNSGFQKRFGLILTLPRKNEAANVLQNALLRLQMINKAMSGLGSIILVDNQKLFDFFVETKNDSALISDYLKFTNEYVANTLHEMNVVTASYRPVGEYHFDSSEFENLVKTPGVLHFAKFSRSTSEVAESNSREQVKAFTEQIGEGVLSEGFDLTKTSRLAISVLANESSSERLFNFGFAQAMETELNQLAPKAVEKPVAFYNYKYQNVKDVYFYAVFAGLSLPERVSELVEENNRWIKLKEQEEKVVDPFASFDRVTSDEDKEVSFEDLFSSSEADDKDVKPKNDKAFDLLFSNND